MSASVRSVRRPNGQAIAHPLEPALRQAVAADLKQNKLEPWMVMAWINMQFPEDNAEQVKLIQEVMKSSQWNAMPTELHYAALEWFKKSAEQGHPAAQFQVGLRYYSGGGVPKDPQRAFELYRSAALQGHAKAQFSLGIMYTNGVHIEKDDVVAHPSRDGFPRSRQPAIVIDT